MRDERHSKFTVFLLAFAVCLSCAFVGCDSGSATGTVAKVSPEAEKKTQDMLNGIQDKMKGLHQGEGKVGRRGPGGR